MEELVEKTEKNFFVFFGIQPIPNGKVLWNTTRGDRTIEHVEDRPIVVCRKNMNPFRNEYSPAPEDIGTFMDSVFSEESIGVPIKSFSGKTDIIRKRRGSECSLKMPVSSCVFRSRNIEASHTRHIPSSTCLGKNGWLPGHFKTQAHGPSFGSFPEIRWTFPDSCRGP